MVFPVGAKSLASRPISVPEAGFVLSSGLVRSCSGTQEGVGPVCRACKNDIIATPNSEKP